MAAQKPTPRALEGYHNVKKATVLLGLATDDPEDKRGQKWLRDGVNLHGWPCHRMAGQLMFSDSNLAEIASMHANATTRRGRTRRATRKKTAPARKPASSRQLQPAA
jgi:hypothetical protein